MENLITLATFTLGLIDAFALSWIFNILWTGILTIIDHFIAKKNKCSKDS